MKKWEFTMCGSYSELTKLGLEGWELVNDQRLDAMCFEYYLKREIKDTDIDL